MPLFFASRRTNLSTCLALTLATTCSTAIGQNIPPLPPEEIIQTGAASFTQRPQDDERPEEQFTVKWFNRPLTIGGEIDTKLRYREDVSLGRRHDDDLRLSLGLQLEFLYRLTPDTSLYIEIDPSYQTNLYAEDDDTDTSRKIELGELWVYVGGLGNHRLSLQIGRQYFGDQREWWWDEQLDAVRVQYTDGSFSAQFAIGVNPTTTISTESDRPDPEDEDIIWLIASADWAWTKKNHFEMFFLSRLDHSPTPNVGDIISEKWLDNEDAMINWLGLRSRGRVKSDNFGKAYYWLDSGVIYGKETLLEITDIGDSQSKIDQRRDHTISGWGLDFGATWASKLPYQPRLTFGYAKGSGDTNPNDGMNRAYRQSGLQSNDHRFRGVNSFRYYGELSRPELSNLTIRTLALGFPLLKDSSLELIYHRYTQVHASDRLRNSRIRTRPEGKHRDIGEEFNIILGMEEWQQLELELVVTQFRAGKAYGIFSGKKASSITLQVQYNF